MKGKKRTAVVVEDTENRGRKRQREEPITVHSPQPTTVEHSLGTMNTPHESTLPVSIQMDDITTLASRQHSMRIPDVNVVLMSDPATGSSKIAIPSKRRNPFGGGGLRKKNRTERHVNVRVYAQQKDLIHTHEIQCTLTPDGGLDLVSLSQELGSKGCQAS
jgi:hypothetical protein